MRRHFILTITLTLIASLTSLNSLRAQLDFIWPGDVNNNGIVNGVDALYLGVAMGSTGPARILQLPDWLSLPAPNPWFEVFPSGLNYYYADCNGDGFITLDDLEDAIKRNFLETHGELQPDGYANASTDDAPRIRLMPRAEVVPEGTEILIEVFVNDDENQLFDFYGVALELSYRTAGGTVLDTMTFEPDFAWIDPFGLSRLSLFEIDQPNKKSYMTMSRTNQLPVRGGGKVGEISIIMEDIVLGHDSDTLYVQVDSVLLINPELETTPTAVDTGQVIIVKDPNSLEPAPQKTTTKVYPNPTHGMAFLEVEAELSVCELYNARGQVIPLRLSRSQVEQYQLQWSEDLPVGVYYLRLVRQDGRTESQKIFIH